MNIQYLVLELLWHRKGIKAAEYEKEGPSKAIDFGVNLKYSINLITESFGNMVLKEGDTVLLTEMEHHANIVPWKHVCDRIDAKIDYVRFLDNGELDMEEYGKKIKHAKIVAFTHISNVLGTINPIKSLVDIAKTNNVYTIVDGAQGVSHNQINVQEVNTDFYVFSGHKVFGPTGVGVLYGRKELLERNR